MGTATAEFVEQSVVIACYGVRILVQDDSGHALCSKLAELLPPECVFSAATGGLHHEITIRDVNANPNHPVVMYGINGEPKVQGQPDLVLRHLVADIDALIASASRELLFVHAGAVEWCGYAILIPGRSKSGKSTLVRELVRRGATYYSDEYAVLDDQGKVHPYARPLTIRDSNGWQRPIDDRPRASDAPPIPAALIISTSYRPDANWTPNFERGARAALPLLDNLVLARSEKLRSLRLAALLARQTVLLQGARPDASRIAAGILDIVKQAIVARALAGEPATAALAPYVRSIGEVRSPKPCRATITNLSSPSPKVLQLENFLTPEEHGRFFEYAIAQRESYERSGIVNSEGADTVDESYRKSLSLHSIGDMKSMFEPRLRELMPALRRELEIPWFPQGFVEVQLSAHQDGGVFVRHTDCSDGVLMTRKLTCVYFMHTEPKIFSGGDLRVYARTEPNLPERYTALTPKNNSMVFFSSDTLHEVCPVRCPSTEFEHSRFALSIWLHSLHPGDDPLDRMRKIATRA